MNNELEMIRTGDEYTINRRRYLGAAGAALVALPLAGCTDDSETIAEADTDAPVDDNEGETSEEPETELNTDEEPEADDSDSDVEARVGSVDNGVELIEHELVVEPGQVFPYSVEGVLENTTDGTTFDHITINVQYYNAADQVIDDGLDTASNVDPGQQVRFDAISLIADDEEPPAAYEISVEASSY